MERKVQFAKWSDPLDSEEIEENQFDNEDTDWQFSKKLVTGNKHKGNIFVSSIGIIPLGANLASQQNKLYVGHTNFKLTESDMKASTSVDGVEGWRCITPYRFWMMIGWMFNDEQVQTNVRNVLCPIKIEEKFDYREYAACTSPFWTIVKLKSGKQDIVTGNSSGEIKNKLSNRNDVDIIVKNSWSN